MKLREKLFYKFKSMVKERLYLITYQKEYHRCGSIANIIGLKKITTTNINSELSIMCYHIQFEDGEEDFINIHSENWHLVTLSDLLRVGMPT